MEYLQRHLSLSQEENQSQRKEERMNVSAVFLSKPNYIRKTSDCFHFLQVFSTLRVLNDTYFRKL